MKHYWKRSRQHVYKKSNKSNMEGKNLDLFLIFRIDNEVLTARLYVIVSDEKA